MRKGDCSRRLLRVLLCFLLFLVIFSPPAETAVKAAPLPGYAKTGSAGRGLYLPFVQTAQPIVIPATTKPLDPTTAQSLTQANNTSGLYTFATDTPYLQALKPGDVMASSGTTAAPFGFLRKVNSVTRSAGAVTVQTTQATLTEAVTAGRVAVSGQLLPANVMKEVAAQGVQPKVSTDAQLPELVTPVYNVVLYDADGNPNTTYDQVLANGEIRIRPNVSIEMEWSSPVDLKSFTLSVYGTEVANLAITSNLSANLIHKEKEIDRKYFHPFPTGIPFVAAFPVLTVNVGVDGSASANMVTGVNQNGTFTSGITYQGGKWSDWQNYQKTYQFTQPNLDVSANLKGYANVNFAFLMDAAAGPYAAIGPFLSAEVTGSPQMSWGLYLGFDVTLGVRFELLMQTVADYEKTVIEVKEKIAGDVLRNWQEVGAGSASGGGVNQTGTGETPVIAVAPDGTPYLSWDDWSSGTDQIYVKRWDGSNWVEVGAGSASGGGISGSPNGASTPSMAIAPDGTAYVSWMDGTNSSYHIYVKRWNGTSWAEVGAGSASGQGISGTGVASQPSLAIAADGTPYISWTNAVDATDTHAKIFIKRWNGTAWVEVGAGSASGGGVSNTSGFSYHPSLGIAPDGTLYIAWGEAGSGKWIYVKRWNGSSWVEVGPGSASGSGISGANYSEDPSLAVAPDGTPYVSWWHWIYGSYSASAIYVRHWNGANWVEVGAGSASGSGIGASQGSMSNPNVIAVGPNGTPYVCWVDYIFPQYLVKIVLKVWNGAQWVGTRGGEVINDPFPMPNSGRAPGVSLAIAKDGTPYASWMHYPNAQYAIYVERYQ